MIDKTDAGADASFFGDSILAVIARVLFSCAVTASVAVSTFAVIRYLTTHVGG